MEIEERRRRNDPDPRFDLDERNIGFIKDIESPKHIVSMVNDFCVGRFEIVETHEEEDHLKEKLKEFDSEFVRDKPLSILLLLLIAANQLEIKSLMNLVCCAIAVMHDVEFGKFAVDIP